jgi:hypothetical protein
LDGEVHEYPFGRSESEITKFAKKMSGSTVSIIKTAPEANEYADFQKQIVFVAYHPLAAAKEGTVEEKLQASKLTQVFAQVARKEQAFGIFLLLDAHEDEFPFVPFGQEGPFVCRVEAFLPVRCYTMVTDDKLDMKELLGWVRSQNVPTVVNLTPKSLGTFGRKGRPLVIGVVKDEKDKNEVAIMKGILTKYATEGPEDIRDKYYYGYFPGQRYAKFLDQFNVVGAPEIFVLDVPSKMYYQDESFKDLESFLRDIEDGKIKPRKSRKPGVEGFLSEAMSFMEGNIMLGAIGILIILFIVFIKIALWASSDDIEENYPEPPAPEEESKKDK